MAEICKPFILLFCCFVPSDFHFYVESVVLSPRHSKAEIRNAGFYPLLLKMGSFNLIPGPAIGNCVHHLKFRMNTKLNALICPSKQRRLFLRLRRMGSAFDIPQNNPHIKNQALSRCSLCPLSSLCYTSGSFCSPLYIGHISPTAWLFSYSIKYASETLSAKHGANLPRLRRRKQGSPTLLRYQQFL